MSEVSICNGRSVTACISHTALVSAALSSIPGRPTFTSRTCAPASACFTASERIYAVSPSVMACLSRFLPVGLMRSPITTGAPPKYTA